TTPSTRAHSAAPSSRHRTATRNSTYYSTRQTPHAHAQPRVHSGRRPSASCATISRGRSCGITRSCLYFVRECVVCSSIYAERLLTCRVGGSLTKAFLV